MFNFKNKEKGEILLVKLNHILLKEGDNELDLTPRRMNIAKEEIEERKLNIVKSFFKPSLNQISINFNSINVLLSELSPFTIWK